jgi:ADP-ribose pyrophosphatase YjhB (NUDIX family)
MITCTFENGSENQLRHAVIDALVLKGDEILLVKRAKRFLEGGKWALIGGFMEMGETIKEAVAREVLEETGYKVTGITLFRIIDNPNRPGDDRQHICFVHYCTALEKIGAPDSENDAQQWFTFSALPPENEIAFEHLSNIRLYEEYIKKPFTLPKIG